LSGVSLHELFFIGSIGTLSDSNLTNGSVSLTVAEAVYSAVSTGYVSWYRTILSVLDLMFVAVSPVLGVDFIGIAAGTSVLNNNYIITCVEMPQ
jgi:hypothetical protein